MQNIILFPSRERVEVFTVADRVSGRPLHVLEWIGHDEAGPFRIVVADTHLAAEVPEFVETWRHAGVRVIDIGLRL